MLIKRKEFAKADYSGLKGFEKEALKEERKRLADYFRKNKKRLSVKDAAEAQAESQIYKDSLIASRKHRLPGDGVKEIRKTAETIGVKRLPMVDSSTYEKIPEYLWNSKKAEEIGNTIKNSHNAKIIEASKEPGGYMKAVKAREADIENATKEFKEKASTLQESILKKAGKKRRANLHPSKLAKFFKFFK